MGQFRHKRSHTHRLADLKRTCMVSQIPRCTHIRLARYPLSQQTPYNGEGGHVPTTPRRGAWSHHTQEGAWSPPHPGGGVVPTTPKRVVSGVCVCVCVSACVSACVSTCVSACVLVYIYVRISNHFRVSCRVCTLHAARSHMIKEQQQESHMNSTRVGHPTLLTT